MTISYYKIKNVTICQFEDYSDRQLIIMNDKNFGLAEDDFSRLVAEMKLGNEDLFERIFLNHFEKAITFLMIKYGAPREVAYDICMDSLLYVRKLLLNDKIHYGNLRALFNQISSQKYFKYTAKQEKGKLIEPLPALSAEETQDRNDNLLLLNKAWDRLSEECQRILKNYYYNNRKLYDIAEQMSKTPAALRKQKERCVSILRTNFRQSV